MPFTRWWMRGPLRASAAFVLVGVGVASRRAGSR
jgi:hypothetical protein